MISTQSPGGSLKKDSFILFCTFLGGVILLFIIAPLAGMVLNTTPASLFETLGDRDVGSSIILTLFTAMGATLLFTIPAVPLAYMLARHKFPFKGLVMGIIDVPIVIPHSAAGIAILGTLSRNTLPGKIAGTLGINLVSSPAGIIAAMAFVSLPFLINSAYNGFCGVPEKLEKAAMTLGASRWRVFFTISLPMAWRSVLSGLILMWARGMSEFGAVIIVAYHPMTTPVLIFERFNAFGLKYARPVAVAFIAICLLLFIVLRLIGRKNKND